MTLANTEIVSSAKGTTPADIVREVFAKSTAIIVKRAHAFLQLFLLDRRDPRAGDARSLQMAGHTNRHIFTPWRSDHLYAER